MKLLYCCLLLFGVGVLAEERVKRQASYTFPGPRTDRAYRQPQSNAAPVYVEEEDRDAYQAPRRQFQAQPVQPQYAPSQQRAPPAAAAPPAPVYEQPRAAAPAPAPRQQSASTARRRASTTSNRANKYPSAPQQSLNAPEEEEEDTGPDPLTLLLEDSQFACDGKNDGYYADDSVNCQVFHYCVGGAKHSWMCPENTVFHQVHLNCVPDAQDICAQSQKFHFVNDYLYKPVDYEGPNNTARYSQRYYPENYVVGDALVAPQEQAPRRPSQQVQSYPAAPPPRSPPRQVAPAPPPQPAYRAPPQSAPAYSRAQQSRPASRPSRPVESYPAEAPPQGYRTAPVEAPQTYPAQPQSVSAAEAYRPAQPQPQPQPPQRQQDRQQRRPSPQAYRVVSAVPQQEPPASHSSYSSEESPYQPQPQARRPSPPVQQTRPTASYSPPRQQYRPNARSSGGYVYGADPGAGVQYDEEY